MTTPRSRALNKRGQGAHLRDEIVGAAAKLVDGGLPPAVTLRAVARAAGISAPAIYLHFPDVDSILLAVTQQAFAALERELGEPGDADPADRLRAVCAAYLSFAERQPHRYRVMFGGVWNAEQARRQAPALTDELAVLGMGAFDLIRGALADCVTAGRSASVDPFTDATALWVGLHGLAQLRVATPLFPWPPELQRPIIDRLALLRD
ncbi:TetR/AcrR family transcriptional regulator [Paractinoplanes ferrugineus]|uniref:TetR family transcriptional regulator n=1 Tax=Paractinoplanes ferrugineus TaxID=113564 RepID=A0A919JBB3_9ACTN|nr:TetR/AcrR family transcriptional regulator [Actinoplanes ferrugineus]GIE16687.1 TetR family transcriptional regulator [Actinoplanes ferrugineus]